MEVLGTRDFRAYFALHATYLINTGIDFYEINMGEVSGAAARQDCPIKVDFSSFGIVGIGIGIAIVVAGHDKSGPLALLVHAIGGQQGAGEGKRVSIQPFGEIGLFVERYLRDIACVALVVAPSDIGGVGEELLAAVGGSDMVGGCAIVGDLVVGDGQRIGMLTALYLVPRVIGQSVAVGVLAHAYDTRLAATFRGVVGRLVESIALYQQVVLALYIHYGVVKAEDDISSPCAEADHALRIVGKLRFGSGGGVVGNRGQGVDKLPRGGGIVVNAGDVGGVGMQQRGCSGKH